MATPRNTLPYERDSVVKLPNKGAEESGLKPGDTTAMGNTYVSSTGGEAYVPRRFDAQRQAYIDFLYPSPRVLKKTSPTLRQGPYANEKGLSAAQPGDPEPYVFGRKLVTPQIIAASVHQQRLYVDYLLSVGECEEFEYIQQGGQIWSENPTTLWEYFLGTSGQSASTLMTAAKGGTYDTLANKCHFVVALTPFDSMDIKVMLKGLKLFDPRPSPQVSSYSNNPALALARVYQDSGYQLDWDSVAELANYCDEDVEGSPRWTLDLPVMNRNPLREWAHTLAQYCGGSIVVIDGGVVKFVKIAAVTSSPAITHTVTADDILGTPTTTKVGTRKVPQKVIVQYQEAAGAGRTAVVGSGSSGEIARLSLPGFSSYTMAARFGVQTRNKSQADIRHSHITFDAGIEHELGDLATVTFAPHGLSDFEMRLIDAEETERGRWKRDYIEHDNSLFSDSVFIEPDPGDTDLDNPNIPADGPIPLVVEELFTDETGTTYSRLKITFLGTEWAYAMNYQIVANGEQNVLNALIPHEGTGTHTIYTAALKQGVLYLIEVRIQSITGVLSAVPGTATITAKGKLLPPGDVPWANFFEAGSLVAGNWGAAEEITGDLRGYTIKRLPLADYTGTSADWTHTNQVLITDRLDAQSILTASQPQGTFYYCIKAIDNAGNESVNALCKKVVVTIDAWSTNTVELDSGTLTNMHRYVIDGDAAYCVTSTGETWTQRFESTSPITWSSQLTASPQERWGQDIQTDSTFQTEVWDTGAMRGGNFYFSDAGVTVLGGTQGNIVRLGDDSSPISYTDNVGNTVQATARHMIAKVYTTDSPATAGDGLHIQLPIEASYSGAILPQSGTVVIANTSPLINPTSVVFTTAYTDNPFITLTAHGTAALIPIVDNISPTGFDLYLFDISGNKVAGTVTWDATGT